MEALGSDPTRARRSARAALTIPSAAGRPAGRNRRPLDACALVSKEALRRLLHCAPRQDQLRLLQVELPAQAASGAQAKAVIASHRAAVPVRPAASAPRGAQSLGAEAGGACRCGVPYLILRPAISSPRAAQSRRSEAAAERPSLARDAHLLSYLSRNVSAWRECANIVREDIGLSRPPSNRSTYPDCGADNQHDI
eukprot:scaffold19225_cov107-Isochrysis_galbana.AAC.3